MDKNFRHKESFKMKMCKLNLSDDNHQSNQTTHLYNF